MAVVNGDVQLGCALTLAMFPARPGIMVDCELTLDLLSAPTAPLFPSR